MGRIASAAIVMPRERFVYLRIYDIFVQEIWIHASVEVGRNIWRTGEEIDRASSLTLSLFPSLFPRSTPLRRCTANVVELTRGAFFAHHRAPSRPLFPLHPNYLSITGFYFFPVAVEVFCNPRKWCIPKGNRFHPWTRPYARLSSIFLFLAACSQICRNLNVPNLSLFPEGKHHEHCFLKKRMESSLIQEHKKAWEDFQLNTRTSILNYSRLFSKWM